jgi:pimeloyl-ACP methyl ester carboxylesterase
MRFAAFGHDVDYDLLGEGRTVVFLHGLTLDRALLAEACEPVFAERPGWRRLYLDLPGHGRSRAGLENASADALVATVRALLKRVAGPRPAVVAHAYGAYLAQGLVAAGPSPAGLFLACPVVEPDVAARRVPPQRFAVVEDGLEFVDEAEHQAFDGEACVYTRAMLDTFRRVVQPGHRAADRRFIEELRAHYVLSFPLGAALRGYAGPTTVVCGRDDYWSGFEDAVRLIALIARAELAVVPDGGPLLPLERPDRFRALLADWLGRLPEASG